MKEIPRSNKLTVSNPVDKFLFFSDATYIAPSVIGITTEEILLHANITPKAVPSMCGSTEKAIMLPN